MLTKESIYVILYAIPIYQLLFYTVQLISFKRTNPSKKYLGMLLLSMTLFLLFNAIHYLGYLKAFSYLYIIYLPVLLCIAPAYFLYILSITHENHDVNKRQRLILFSPAIFFLVLNISVLGALGHSGRMSLVSLDILNQGTWSSEIPGLLIGFWIGAIFLVFGQIIFAIVKVLRIMQTETDLMRKQPSHLAYLEWRWVLGISLSVMIFLVINALVEMLVPMTNLGIVIVYNVLMLVSGGLTGLLGMKQDTLLNQVEQINGKTGRIVQPNDDSTIADKSEIVPSGIIPGTEADQIHKMIINLLEEDKPYLKSEFSLHDLSNRLNVSRRKISYVLNDIMHKSFYGIINEYRIRDSEELLKRDDMKQLKIEALGEMVGFQSKSSFNACFKKVTGMTPSEYRMKEKLL